MRIKVEAWCRARDSEVTMKVTEAVFVYVAIGEDLRPLPVV